MNEQKWQTIQKCAALEAIPAPPVALIVDSPWIPGYLGISTLDYLTIPEIWLEANLEVENRFPGAIFLPGFWVELGMAAEPSGFGCRLNFYEHKTPVVHPIFTDINEAKSLKIPNPTRDGLMPWILNLYRYAEPRVKDAGHMIKMVAARGPLALATHLMGVSDFLVSMKMDPAATHHLLKITTRLVKDWLSAQADVLSEVESVMLLDDIVGFLSPDDYEEFAHPYLKEILDAFPDALKVFHNDMDNLVSYHCLQDAGVQIFNFTHKFGIAEVRHHVGPQVCLMGNVAPLDTLAKGSPEQVAAEAKACLDAQPGWQGLILSAGGGVSPDTPGENIQALLDTAQSYAKNLS